MIAELGNYALGLSLAIALLLAALPLWGAEKGNDQLMALARPMTYGLFLALTVAFGALFYAFAVNDFTVQYVVNNSNSNLPLRYRLSAVWGSHEGSLLLWIWLLTLWSTAVAWFSKPLPQEAVSRVLGIMGIVSVGFLLFVLFTSNPFDRTFPNFPVDGRELNPLLQDVGLIFHPPLLYMGYVGFSVAFAFSIASLMTGKLDTAWARWSRPWTMAAWVFLTLGIVLGSWWAYYELGWGGWWFWDPVENASLMPWLLGTALVHSLIASEQRGVFNYWTILLAIFAFALSLLGTFIVRSGVLTSVHAFAVDPDRGIALLLLFFSLSFIALALFACKTQFWQGEVRFTFFSKETAFLLLNGLFAVATSVVLLGTFYPLVFTMMQWGNISVGAPYFNTIFTPLALLAMSAMGVAVVLRWKNVPLKQAKLQLWLLPVAVLLSLGLIYHTVSETHLFKIEPLPVVFVSLAFWIILTHLPYLRFMWKIRPLAMRLAHIGFAICVIGAMMNSYYGDEIGVRLKPTETANIADFEFKYEEYRDAIGANYTAEQAVFSISKAGKTLAQIIPERRYYDIRTMTMAEVGLYHHGLHDLYIVMGDKFGNLEYAFRLHYKPYVRALWLGGVIMVLASLMALVGYSRRK